MSTDRFMLDGRAYSWRMLCQLRRAQRDELRNSRAEQPVLFELHDDRRPPTERTAAGRYTEPGLFDPRRE